MSSSLPRKGQIVLLVGGTRTFKDEALLKERMEHYTALFENDLLVITGGAKGADALASKWASSNWHDQMIFHPDWEKHGDKAGPIRNTEMVEFVAKHKGFAVFFWDSKSPGTKDCIKKAKKAGITTRIVRYR